ncbi:hypothetical protein LTR70_003360 [Exophiala xenobiotica]|uniref:Amidase domain-containing protein n=1 Tax=Lithohypha guttulata TaxID=1690604 RepID=A0ABR0KH93_9EURO|nr:hypothetical protein LTR24_002908 [Lithohypha guttulata]KAK5323498.1 hypothetical protein LTR70_003360 [Exophiala xenobiotica]
MTMNGTGQPQINTDEVIPRWRQLGLKHRQQQISLIPPEWHLKPVGSEAEAKNAIPVVEQHLPHEELEITSLAQSLPSLQQAIRTKQYTALQITRAFCHRAALLQQLTRCLTEILFDSALNTAERQDAYYASTGQLLGPLHGIPISIKDNQDIKDVDSTLGWVGLIGKPAKSDTTPVEVIRQAGGILYCKTNIPQSMMMSDSYNHIYGQSVNSLNRNLISGGSSGGEAALIRAGGSIVGIGTDIGGSVRIPATLQGLYGLSPSIGRVGNRESTRRDKYVVPPVAGPLTRDIDTLDAFMDAYLGQQPWLSDPGILPIPWRKDIADAYSDPGHKLTIGYITEDGVIRCQPPCVRAVEDTINRLRDAGHKVVEWNHVAQRHHQHAYDLWLKAVLADGGERFQALCDLVDEPLIPGMLVGKAANKLDTDGRMALFDEIWEFQRMYMSLWREAGLDALIMPVTQYTGLRPKMWVEADMYVGYTSLCNLLNWTGLAVPAINVDRELDKVTGEWEGYQGKTFSDQYNHDGYVENFDEFVGMPVGVQIITGRLEEERAVGIARLLERLRKA